MTGRGPAGDPSASRLGGSGWPRLLRLSDFAMQSCNNTPQAPPLTRKSVTFAIRASLRTLLFFAEQSPAIVCSLILQVLLLHSFPSSCRLNSGMTNEQTEQSGVPFRLAQCGRWHVQKHPPFRIAGSLSFRFVHSILYLHSIRAWSLLVRAMSFLSCASTRPILHSCSDYLLSLPKYPFLPALVCAPSIPACVTQDAFHGHSSNLGCAPHCSDFHVHKPEHP